MKKKILSIMLCLLMALSMVTVASAVTYPKIPTDKENIVVVKNRDEYYNGVFAFCSTTARNDAGSNRILMEGGVDTYRYDETTESWVYDSNTTWININYEHAVMYDTTGYLPISEAITIFDTVKSKDLNQYFSKLQEQIKVSTVVEVLVFVAVAIVGLAFMWWGVRKTARVIMSAFRKGKINL